MCNCRGGAGIGRSGGCPGSPDADPVEDPHLHPRPQGVPEVRERIQECAVRSGGLFRHVYYHTVSMIF